MADFLTYMLGLGIDALVCDLAMNQVVHAAKIRCR